MPLPNIPFFRTSVCVCYLVTSSTFRSSDVGAFNEMRATKAEVDQRRSIVGECDIEEERGVEVNHQPLLVVVEVCVWRVSSLPS